MGKEVIFGLKKQFIKEGRLDGGRSLDYLYMENYCSSLDTYAWFIKTRLKSVYIVHSEVEALTIRFYRHHHSFL